MNFLLQRTDARLLDEVRQPGDEGFARLAEAMEMSAEDLERLWVIWGEKFNHILHEISRRRCSLRVRLLSDPDHPESAEPFAPLPDGN